MPDFTLAPAGSIQGATKKPDYESTFDSQQRTKDELSVQHGWAASSAVDGKHNGIQYARTTASVAGPVTASNRLSVAKSLFTGGLWELRVLTSNATNGKITFSILLRDGMPTFDVYITKINTTITWRHNGGHAYQTTAPASGTWFRVYIDGDNLKIDLTDDSAVSTTIIIEYHQLSNYSA